MRFEEYARCDALALAEHVRRREVSAGELLAVALARIEAVNPQLNAVIRRRDDAARAEAARIDAALPDAPFAGVPFLVKDLIATLAGEPTSMGTRLLANVPMTVDTELVRRFRAAGLVVAGRTNTPEFGLMPVTEPRAFGPTRNPWSLAHTPGGSSGGSAAAVAARIVPMASGGDGGGSIRMPASCCGLFGFKPSRGLVPTGPIYGELWNGLATEGVLTRSVRDSAAMLDAIAGADGGAPYAAPQAERPYRQEVQRDPGRLRIAFTTQPLIGKHVHDDCVAGVADAAKLLASLGHEVEEAVPPMDRDACALAFITLIAGNTWADIEAVSRLGGRAKPHAADFEPATFAIGLLGRKFSAARYAAAEHTLQLTARAMAPFFERYDVLLTPTLGGPPPLIGALAPSKAELGAMRVVNALRAGWLLDRPRVIAQLADKTFDFMPFTPLFNATGQPAMSVPLVWNAAGLPIGMQFVSRLGADGLLYRLAGQLEQARPWFERTPPGF